MSSIFHITDDGRLYCSYFTTEEEIVLHFVEQVPEDQRTEEQTRDMYKADVRGVPLMGLILDLQQARRLALGLGRFLSTVKSPGARGPWDDESWPDDEIKANEMEVVMHRTSGK